MNKAETGRFWGILVAILGIEAALVALGGGVLRFDYQEGDTLHMAALILRSAAGQVAHLDYATPIGEWAYRPFALLLQLIRGEGPHGVADAQGLGHAIRWGQWAVSVLLAPAVGWICWSRFRFWPAVALAVMVLMLPVALVPGGTDTGLTLSMHYNRWAWALAIPALVIVLFPPDQGRAGDWADATVLGLAMGLLVLVKVTYVVALLPGAVVGLLITGRQRLLLRAVLVSLVPLLLVTLAHGIAYWRAYVEDLLIVMSSSRDHPGLPFLATVFSPRYTLGTLAALGAAMLLKGIPGRGPMRVTLLLLLPGLLYITYQNYDNDPLWLAPLGLCLLGLPGPEADADRERILRTLGGAMLLLIGPVLLNLAYSPLRPLLARPAESLAALPGSEDFRAGGDRWARSVARQYLRPEAEESTSVPLAGRAGAADDGAQDGSVTEASFAGAALPGCGLESGALRYFASSAELLVAGGQITDGLQPFVADRFGLEWLYAGWDPLPGGAPWYYTGLPGFAAASHLLVPLCAFSPVARREILAQIDPQTVTLVEETALYRLYEIRR